MSKFIFPTVIGSVLAAATVAFAQPPVTVTAEIKDAKGAAIGSVVLTQAPKGVLIRLETTGLTPGWHGLHLHETGDCSASDFTSAGGHTHGGGSRVHGLLNPNANETGDLPNLFADHHGAASAELFTALTTLPSLKDANGSALVIHASPDDHLAQPIGGSGGRVACAVIN